MRNQLHPKLQYIKPSDNDFGQCVISALHTALRSYINEPLTHTMLDNLHDTADRVMQMYCADNLLDIDVYNKYTFEVNSYDNQIVWRMIYRE